MRHLRTSLPVATLAAVAAALAPAASLAHTEQTPPANAKPATPKPLPLPAKAAPKSSAAGKPQTVRLRFKAVAGDTPVSCGTPIEQLGSTATSAQLQDLRFYVSAVKLLRKDGKQVTLKVAKTTNYRVAGSRDAVTLIDLENATGACASVGTTTTNRAVIGTVPRGTYVGVSWTLGVPFALNHGNTVGAAPPLSLASMAWSWQAGRKFTKIEFADPGGAAGTWSAKRFFVHLGSTGCTGSPVSGETVSCKAPNRGQVTLKAFDPASQDVAVDLRALLAGNDITKNAGGAAGCMSGPTDPECVAVFKALGVTISPDGTGGLPTTTQTLFRAIDR